MAAGRTFSSRTLEAGWAARGGHTSVVDAVSGAIYVIGGYYTDVWASTNGGARAGLGRGAVGGVALGGYYGGTKGVLRGYYLGTKGLLRAATGYSRCSITGVRRGTSGVVRAYLGVTRRILGSTDGYQGVLRGYYSGT